MIESEKADIVLATETHLDDSFPSNSGLPPGYSAFRTDNYLGSGGTMLVYRNDLLVSPLDNGNSDVTWGKILVQGRKPIYIGSIYRNPASNVKMLECLEEDIAKLEPGNTLPLIILGGDINLPSIIWENSSVSPNPQYGSTINQKVHRINRNLQPKSAGQGTDSAEQYSWCTPYHVPRLCWENLYYPGNERPPSRSSRIHTGSKI